MNTLKIFRNSWSLMLRYRNLWLFGVILSLTTVSFGSALWFRANENRPEGTLVNWEISTKDKAWIQENFGIDLPLHYTLKTSDLQIRLDDPSLSNSESDRLLNIAVTVLLTLLILCFSALVLRYSAEASLIQMVHDQQERNEVHNIRKGWSLGFSTVAFKLFLIDVIIFSMLLILTPLLFLPDLLPALIAINGRPASISVSLLLMTSLSLFSLAAMIVLWITGLITRKLAFRACCLEGLGVFASIWRGFRLTLSQLGGVGLTSLVNVGWELVYPILVAPVVILLAASGLTISGFLALILGNLLALVLVKTAAWSIAFSVAIVLLVLTVVIPMTFLDGLREVFKSSAWTLTFNEAVRNQNALITSTPKPAPPQVNLA